MAIVAPTDYGTIPKDVVLVAGCFDPLHPGHLAYFEKAATFGPVCCAVASDETIAKTKHRPALQSQAARMKLIAALAGVSYVVAADDAGDAGMIEDLRPRFYAKGKDWLDHLPDAEAKACHQFGIPTLFLDGGITDSSSECLRRWLRDVDGFAVDRFEEVVHRQRPASQPWHPVTDYSADARALAEGRHPDLILEHLLPADGGTILDYGCGPDAHLCRLLLQRASRDVSVLGYDPQRPGSDVALSGPSDLVICREVLEHLTVLDLVWTVRELVRLSSGLVYVTTRFGQEPDHLLAVEESDDLDPTHITMLTKDFLRTLFILEGCTSRRDLEARMDWQQKGRCLVFEVPRA